MPTAFLDDLLDGQWEQTDGATWPVLTAWPLSLFSFVI